MSSERPTAAADRRVVSRNFFAIVLLLAILIGAGWMLDRIARGRGRARDRHFAEGAAYAARASQLTGTVPRLLYESSGVAVSRTYDGVLWSHNDAGNDPVIYAIDSEGRLLASLRVTGARSVDWEDISTGLCPTAIVAAGDCLYIGDIGDNSRRRSRYSIYILPEPDPSAVDSQGSGATAHARRLDFIYPDARHDAEALAVGPDGAVTIVTKGRNGFIQVLLIRRAEVESAMEQPGTLAPELIDTLPIKPVWQIGRTVTGASFSPLGGTLAVRTYSEIFFFQMGDSGKFVASRSPCFLGAIEPVGEAVDFLDNETLVVTSEWLGEREGTIYRVRC